MSMLIKMSVALSFRLSKKKVEKEVSKNVDREISKSVNREVQKMKSNDHNLTVHENVNPPRTSNCTKSANHISPVHKKKSRWMSYSGQILSSKQNGKTH